MPLIYKPLAQGQTVPEMLKEMLSFMEDNRPHVFHSPKQVCLTHLLWMCLITRGQEVHRQEIHQEVCLPKLDVGWKYVRMHAFLQLRLMGNT